MIAKSCESGIGPAAVIRSHGIASGRLNARQPLLDLSRIMYKLLLLILCRCTDKAGRFPLGPTRLGSERKTHLTADTLDIRN